MTSCARGCAPSRHARQAGPPRHSPKARGGSAIFRRLGRRAHCRRGRRFAAHTPKASPCRGRSLQDWCPGAPPGSVSALPRAGTPGAPRPQPPALCSRGGPATTPPSLGTAGRPGPGRRGRGARLAVGADRRRGRERERALQDVLERRVALRAPEGREAVQQLVHQDPKAPPAAASTRRCLSWSRCLGMPLHPGVPAEACLGRSKVFSGRTCTWQQRPARLTEQLLCTSTRPSMHAACMLADRKPAVHEATPAHGPPTPLMPSGTSTRTAVHACWLTAGPLRAGRHQSTAAVWPTPLMTSGARYSSVPTNELARPSGTATSVTSSAASSCGRGRVWLGLG
jgi:hypothetical protein